MILEDNLSRQIKKVIRERRHAADLLSMAWHPPAASQLHGQTSRYRQNHVGICARR